MNFSLQRIHHSYNVKDLPIFSAGLFNYINIERNYE